MALVPLSERGGVNCDNSILHQSLGSDQLVVGGIVDDVDDTSLAGCAFGTPGEVASVQTQGPVFFVSSTCTNLSKQRIASVNI